MYIKVSFKLVAIFSFSNTSWTTLQICSPSSPRLIFIISESTNTFNINVLGVELLLVTCNDKLITTKTLNLWLKRSPCPDLVRASWVRIPAMAEFLSVYLKTERVSVRSGIRHVTEMLLTYLLINLEPNCCVVDSVPLRNLTSNCSHIHSKIPE